jgi:hypothetical protein
MTLEQVRALWRSRADAKEAEIMAKYYEQKAGRSGGREGPGIHGQFKSRAAREKKKLAERMLKSAGLPTDEATVRKLMRRYRFWAIRTVARPTP